MTRPLPAAVLVAALLIVACDSAETTTAVDGAASRQSQELTFTTIHVPDAAATIPQGINARGDIVGWYVQAGVTRGFLYSRGEFTTIQVPGAVHTDARGIGPDGTIVGTYRLPGETPGLAFHGYRRLPDGTLEDVHYEGHQYEILQRILPDGTILGCRHDHDLMMSMRGIAITPSGQSETDAFASMHNGGTPNGRRIVGLYTNMAADNRPEAYLIEDGEFNALMVPGSTLTSAWDMNAAGLIVGNYRDAAGLNRAFLLGPDGYTSIDVPGATITRAWGINNAGDIVGSYVLGGVSRGYLATRGQRGGK